MKIKQKAGSIIKIQFISSITGEDIAYFNARKQAL